MKIEGMRFDRERLRPLESADKEQLIEFIAILLDVMVDRPDMLELALETIRRQPQSARSASHVADSFVGASRQSTYPSLVGRASDPIRLEPARRSRSRSRYPRNL